MTGLAFCVEKDHRPGLWLEAAASRRVRMATSDGPVLWARSEQGSYGVWVVRSSTVSHELLAPIGAQQARRLQGKAWLKWFAQALLDSNRSPLRVGTWQLTWMAQESAPSPLRAPGTEPDIFFPQDQDRLPCVAYGVRSSLAVGPVHYEDWGINGSGGVLPLRTPSPSNASRVKSWRKHARKGTLPPILLWWVGALDAYVILDGHDRLVAAVAEGKAPDVVALWQPLDTPIPDPGTVREHYLDAYDKAFAREKTSAVARVCLNRNLVAFFRTHWRRPITTARANPELDRSWVEEVGLLVEDAEERAALLED